jgi:hypothetical protein
MTIDGEAGGHGGKICTVEIVPPGGLTGTLEAECFEIGNLLDPVTVISDKQTLRVKVKWCLLGDLRRHLCGSFCVAVQWESCGPAVEGEWVKQINLDPCDDDGCYELDFDFGPGVLKPGECGTVYCLCVTISSRQICPDGTKYVGLMHGFCKDVCCVMIRPG